MTETLTIPTRAEIIERISERISSGTRPQGISAADVLGVPEARLRALDTRERTPALDDAWARTRQQIGLTFRTASQAAVAAPGGRNLGTVCTWLEQVAAQTGRCIVLEMHRFAGSRALAASNPPQWCTLAVMPDMGDTVRLEVEGVGTMEVPADPARRTPPEGTTVVQVGEVPVAWIGADGRSARLLVNPMQGNDGFSGADMDRRGPLAAAVVAQVVERLGDVFRAEARDADTDAQLREACDLVRTVRGMAEAQLSRLEGAEQQGRERIQQINAQVTQLRTTIAASLAEGRLAERRASVLRSIVEQQTLAELERAYTDVASLNAMAEVVSVRADLRSHHQETLLVDLHPLVLEVEGRRHRVGPITLTIGLGSHNRGVLQCQANAHPRADDYGNIELSDAAVPVAMALGEGRLAVACTLVLRALAEAPGEFEVRTPLARFARTDAAAGWQQPEREVAAAA